MLVYSVQKIGLKMWDHFWTEYNKFHAQSAGVQHKTLVELLNALPAQLQSLILRLFLKVILASITYLSFFFVYRHIKSLQILYEGMFIFVAESWQ